jgi:hypothetical protein
MPPMLKTACAVLSTGDVLLFGLAKEQHAVTHPDYPLRLTIVGDDCAVPRTQGSLVGRRGLAGTVLVYKIASALADTGADIDAVHDIAEYAATRVGTIGAGLDHCRTLEAAFLRSPRYLACSRTRSEQTSPERVLPRLILLRTRSKLAWEFTTKRA